MTAVMSGIGQTWSTPVVVSNVLGYTGPVVIMGGGYDTCEDANTPTPTCTSPNGAGVYVLDANTGAVINSFSTARSVAADVALIATTTAGVIDHAYAVDTGGNIYRIDFAAVRELIGSSTVSPTPTAREENSCSLRRCSGAAPPGAGVRVSGGRFGRPGAPAAERISLSTAPWSTAFTCTGIICRAPPRRPPPPTSTTRLSPTILHVGLLRPTGRQRPRAAARRAFYPIRA